MIFRAFDPENDSIDELSTMNEWSEPAQRGYADALRARLRDPQNVFVAVDDGHIVGAVVIHDGGLPFALIDGVYIAPSHRSVTNARAYERALMDHLRGRGLVGFFSHCPERLAKALEREGYLAATEERFRLMMRKVE